MAETYEEIKNEVKEKITLAGLAAVAAKGTDDFEKRLNDLAECVRKTYLFYLLASYYISYEGFSKKLEREENCPYNITLEDYSKRAESILCACAAISEELKDIKKVSNIVNNYKDTDVKYGFFDYADYNYFRHTKNHAINKEYFDFKRHGIVISKREGELISKCYKFLQEKKMEDFDESTVIEFASKNGYKVEKVKEIWIKEQNLKFQSMDSMYYDEEGNAQEFHVADETAEAMYDEILKNDVFISFIELLNIVYYKDFTANMQRCYPHIFTADFIQSIIDEAKAYTSARSREEMKRKYWDRIDLIGYRDTYATEENVCVVRADFDWSIKNRDYRTRKEVAKLLGVSAERVRGINEKVVELLKRKVAEKHYAE